jgi:hypothetical protein
MLVEVAVTVTKALAATITNERHEGQKGLVAFRSDRRG